MFTYLFFTFFRNVTEITKVRKKQGSSAHWAILVMLALISEY